MLPWLGFNWRYDSGLVAGVGAVFRQRRTIRTATCGGDSILTLNGQPGIDLSSFTADEEFEAGLVVQRGEGRTPYAGDSGSMSAWHRS